MKTLQLEDNEARRIYKTADESLRTILERSFGKEFFSEKITDRIKTWKDVVDEYRNVYGKTVSLPCEGRTKQERAVNAFYQIGIISFVLNEGENTDFKDRNEYKWYPWFERKSSGWVVSGAGVGYFDSAVGFGCFYKTKELALYGGNTFLDIYTNYLPE